MKRPEIAAKVAEANKGKRRPDVSAWRRQAYADGRLTPPVMSAEWRLRASERMKRDNPMRRPEVAAKVNATSLASGAYERRGEASRQFWATHPEFRAAVVQRMKTRNPMFDNDTKERSLSKTRLHLSASKLEQWFGRFCALHTVPVWYTGTGQFWVKARNPDFKVHGRKLIIEVTDGYNRTPGGRTLDGYAIPTIQHYEGHGFSCLVVMLPPHMRHRTAAMRADLKRSVDLFLATGWSQIWFWPRSIGSTAIPA